MAQRRGRRTASGRLRDEAIHRQVLLERLSVGEQRKITRFLERDVFPDLVARLRSRLDRVRLRGQGSGVFRTKRYRALVEGTAGLLRSGSRAAYKRVRETLAELGIDEAKWQVGAMRSAIPFEVNLALPAPALLRGIVTSRPFEGELLRGWFDGLGRQTQTNLVRQVNIGLAQGEGIEDIVRRVRGGRAVRGVLEMAAGNARSVVRTAVNHVTTQAREMSFQENEELIQSEMWVATLDSRLCPSCAPLDGQTFALDDGPRPPLHIGCRCTMTPVLRSAGELGLQDLSPSTRASMNGQVPETLTAEKWLRDQPAAVQNSVFGVGRAKLWREGRISAGDMVNQANRPIALRDLARLGRVD